MIARRKFLQRSAMLAAGGLILPVIDNKAFAIFKSRFSAADQVNIAAIGINGMGWSNVMAALKVPGVNLVALCDVDKNVIDKRLADLTKNKIDISRIKTYGDYRQLLELPAGETISGTPSDAVATAS